MEELDYKEPYFDPFIERMVSGMPLERTSEGFTTDVMNLIYASVEPDIEPAKYRRQMLWAYGSIGIGIILIALLIFAIWPFVDINFNITRIQILDVINGSLALLDGIKSIANFISKSSLQISIFFAVFLLFVIERLFRKSASDSTFLF